MKNRIIDQIKYPQQLSLALPAATCPSSNRPHLNHNRPRLGQTAPDLPANLADQVWELLLRQTIHFAQYQVQRLCWRGDFDGVLPHGFDANSIAAEAIYHFLCSSPALHSLGDGGSDPIKVIQYHINGLVLKEVSRLHQLKENWIVSNEVDLALVSDMDGEPISPIELIPAPDDHPGDVLLHQESLTHLQNLKQRFTDFLAKDTRLITLVELGSDSICKPQAQASRLKVRITTVRNLRKRLRGPLEGIFPVPKFPVISLIRPKFLQEYFVDYQPLTTAPKKIVPPNGKFSILDTLYIRGT